MQISYIKNEKQGITFNSVSAILGLYFYTLGTLMLGFSLYLFTLTNSSENTLTTWSGQTIFWSLIIFFTSIFVLFLPVEFFNNTKINNNNFSELVINIVIVIIISLSTLLLSQLLNQDSQIFYEVKSLVRSVSFSGFITVPFILFLFQNFLSKISFFTKYSYHLILLIWILSSQIFL
tara:strand:+ start:197 stop:727 length:531 start_codon:yes stop_codon:yes gene_type:complete